MSALGPIELLFLLGPLVVVPLALRLAAPEAEATWALTAARRLQPWAAAAVVGSFLVGRRGVTSAALVVPWMLVTLLIALHGALRLRQDARRMTELAIDAGCAMLPIGGGWLILSRLGASVLGFEEPILLLTAVHFHYAAFATLVLVGMAGRAAGESAAYRVIAVGAMSGPPMLAVGITLSPLIEILAALLLALALGGLSILTLVRIVPRLRGPACVLLVISSISILAGMACAVAYAVGEFTGIGIISLGQMARIHGPLNGLGFALVGVLGWTATPRNFRGASL